MKQYCVPIIELLARLGDCGTVCSGLQHWMKSSMSATSLPCNLTFCIHGFQGINAKGSLCTIVMNVSVVDFTSSKQK